jgi:hypothetical protein
LETGVVHDKRAFCILLAFPLEINMPRKAISRIVACLLFAAPSYPQSASFDTPRLGIVISTTSVTHHWGVAQMSAHGWAAVANLAGIPYDCLFLEEIAKDEKLNRYDLLIFGQCGYVAEPAYQDFKKTLQRYVAGGGNVIVDGPLATSDERARDRRHDDLTPFWARNMQASRAAPIFASKSRATRTTSHDL